MRGHRRKKKRILSFFGVRITKQGPTWRRKFSRLSAVGRGGAVYSSRRGKRTFNWRHHRVWSVIIILSLNNLNFASPRASIHAIKDALLSENVHVLGHSQVRLRENLVYDMMWSTRMIPFISQTKLQWVWHPKELGVPYKFVHFYRHPFKKIVSGFRWDIAAPFYFRSVL